MVQMSASLEPENSKALFLLYFIKKVAEGRKE
jgi:hypothetical protein